MTNERNENKNVKSVFGGIGIASLLCVLMVLMSWSAMVTNSDINSETSDSVESQEVKPDGSDSLDAVVEPTCSRPKTLVLMRIMKCWV